MQVHVAVKGGGVKSEYGDKVEVIFDRSNEFNF